MAIKKNLTSTMSSIEGLQRTCNTHERRLSAKLTGLKAALDTDGVKVTEATFEEVEDNFGELGKLKIEEFSEAKKPDAIIKDADAFILTVRTKVLVFRGE